MLKEWKTGNILAHSCFTSDTDCFSYEHSDLYLYSHILFLPFRTSKLRLFLPRVKAGFYMHVHLNNYEKFHLHLLDSSFKFFSSQSMTPFPPSWWMQEVFPHAVMHAKRKPRTRTISENPPNVKTGIKSPTKVPKNSS